MTVLDEREHESHRDLEEILCPEGWCQVLREAAGRAKSSHSAVEPGRGGCPSVVVRPAAPGNGDLAVGVKNLAG